MRNRVRLFLILATIVILGSVGYATNSKGIVGSFFHFFGRFSSHPGPAGTDRLWVDNQTQGHAIHTDTSNVDRYIPEISPSPSPTLDGQCVVADSTKPGGFKLASCGSGGGGSSTLATAYSTGAAPSDETVVLDNTRKGVLITDNGTPITPSTGLGLFDVTDSAKAKLYFDVTSGGVNSIGTFGFGPGSYSGAVNGWWYLANRTATSGGATLQNGPDIVQEGKVWNGSASQTIASVLNLTASGAGTSGYATNLKITLGRNGSFGTPLTLVFDGSNSYVLSPVLVASVISTGLTANGSSSIDFSGSTGTWRPPTGGLAASLALDSDATRSIGSDLTHRLSDIWAKNLHVTDLSATPAWWQGAQIASDQALAISDGAQNLTVGHKVMFSQAVPLTGIKFVYQSGYGTNTVTADIWNAGGTSVASCTVSASASQTYSCKFGSPYTPSTNVAYYVTIYLGGSSHFPYVPTASWTGPLPGGINGAFYVSPWEYLIGGYTFNGGGHSVPTGSGSHVIPLEVLVN
jgi:hypothetical protein